MRSSPRVKGISPRLSGRLFAGAFVHAPIAKASTGVIGLVAVGMLLAASLTVPKLSMEAPPNPTNNIAPVPNFLASGNGRVTTSGFAYDNPCITPQATWPVFSKDPACDNYVLSAINNARLRENLPPMVLPSNWSNLSVPQQMLVVTNLERVARGYPPYLGLNATLNQAALVAAQHLTDPNPAPGFTAGFNALGQIAWGGSWAEGFNVLSGMYVMMYADGWAGSAQATSNIACTSAVAPGCWAHREELLGNAPHFNPGVGLWCDTCEEGAGFAIVQGHPSYSQLIEMPTGTPPPLTFSWSRELLYFPSGAIGDVKTVHLSKMSFNTSTLRVLWSVSGTQGSSLVVVYTFSGSQCGRMGRTASFRYVPAFNIRRSTVTLSGSRIYFPHGWYSAVVRVYSSQGPLTSRCIVIGRV